MKEKKKPTQADDLLTYLEHHGSITRIQGMTELGIIELPARVTELRKLGVDICKERKTGISRNGRTFHYTVYSLGARS